MSDQVDRIMTAIEQGIARTCSEIALEIHHRLVVATPVDTGWARANWIPSVGKPFEGTIGFGANGDVGAVAAFRIGQGSIFVANNIAYMTGPGSLDDGHSKQAARGFIRKSIEDGTNAVQQRHAGRWHRV